MESIVDLGSDDDLGSISKRSKSARAELLMIGHKNPYVNNGS